MAFAIHLTVARSNAGIATANDDFGAAIGKPLRNAETDAATAASHQRDLVGQIEIRRDHPRNRIAQSPRT